MAQDEIVANGQNGVRGRNAAGRPFPLGAPWRKAPAAARPLPETGAPRLQPGVSKSIKDAGGPQAPSEPA